MAERERPTDYYLEYEDDELVARALKRAGGNHDLVDPADLYAIRDVATIEEARVVAPTLPCSVRAAALRRRIDIYYEPIEGIIPSWSWDDEETIDEILWD